MKYRKIPVVIEATQWFKNGDHPKDDTQLFPATGSGAPPDKTEGKVVRYYRRPGTHKDTCKECEKRMHIHGWIDTKEGGHIVCPGDWIITGTAGERYPCKPNIFPTIYELVKEA